MIYRVLGICLSRWCLRHIIDGFGTFVLLSCYIRIRSRCIDGILSLSSFFVYFCLSCILLFACQVRVFLNRVLLSVRCLSYRILRVCFSSWCLWNGVNRVLTSIFLRCYIRIACRCVDGILSLSRFGVYLSLGCILLFACQVRVFLNRILLSVRCLSYRVFSVSLRCWCLWRCINRVLTSIFLRCYIRIAGCGIDGILSLSRFGVYLSLSCVLLFASQVRVFLNRVLLSVCCLSDCILGVCFRSWCLWNSVNRVLTCIFLRCYIRIAGRSIDGILSLSCFGVYLGLSCVFLFTSQVRIILDGILLSVGCLSYRVFSISFRCWGLWHCINRVLTSIFLSRYIRVACRRIDCILSLSRFGVYLSLGCILLFASQVRVFLNRVLLSVRCLSDCILSVGLSLRRLRNGIDSLRTFVLLSRHVIVASCGIDSILGLSRFGVYLSFGCILLFASQVWIVFDG